MEILIAAIVFVGFAVFIMCFNIIFRKKPFPDGEIEHNKELRKRGIICAREEEMRLRKEAPAAAAAPAEVAA